MQNAILRVQNVHKSYGSGRAEVKVLRGASMTVHQGEFLVVTGASGSGKSTLLHLMGALDIPDRGEISFRGENIFSRTAAWRERYRCQLVGFIFQFYHLLPELNVLENILLPRMVGTSLFAWKRHAREARRQAGEILERVGLSQRLTHRPRQLSGGEQQRVAIARALVNRPALLLADEPTGNLDERIGEEILYLLAEFNRDGQTIVMVTHDTKVASRGHRRVVLSEGVVRAAPDAREARELADTVHRE